MIRGMRPGMSRPLKHIQHTRTAHFAQVQLRNNQILVTVIRIMPRMSAAELRAEMERLGETPPKRWTRVEMGQRLDEMYEEQPHMKPKVVKKNKTDLRLQVVALNQNSRKKSQLQEWCRTHLRMPVSGNETIAQLQKAAMLRIYEETTPAPEDPVGFGKAASLTYQEISEDTNYCAWVKQTAAEGDGCVQLKRLARWLNQTEDEKMPPVAASRHKMEPVPSPSKKSGSQTEEEMTPEMTMMIKQLVEAVHELKDEVDELRSERPRRTKKKEGSEASFSVVEKDQ